MFRKTFVLALIIALLNLFLASSAFGITNEEAKRAERAEKVKAGIAKLGTGIHAKVEIRLYDKTKIKGFVKEASPDGFVIVESTTGVEKEVSYPSVKQVKGNNLSSGVKLAIGIAIILAIGIFFALQTK